MAQTETAVQAPNEGMSKEILKFLKDGEGKIEIGQFKNVTLVLGFTGSGKSTLTQFLTGNDEGMFAMETGAETGKYTILNKNDKICRGTIDSCTIIPTLYTDKETKLGFYDCPGFGDTRSVKHDIAVTYFIKKVIDSVDSVKLLFTVNHPSVMEGVDRQNFMLLVKNVVTMVKNVEKFKNSIALAVTKVDNKYIVKKRQFFLVPDSTVIGSVAKFLEKAKESLKAKIPQSKSDDLIFYTEAIKFIDILLEKNGNDYARIGLFRRPEKQGPLIGSTLLQSGKARIQKILQSIQYTPINAEDFGYTVSGESLNQMHGLVDEVNDKLSKTFNYMYQSILDYYTLEESKSQDVVELSETIAVGDKAFSELRENIKYKSPIAQFMEIQKIANAENVTIPMEHLADAEHYDNFLQFIHVISGLSTSSVERLSSLKEAAETLSYKRQWANLLVTLQMSLSDYAVVSEINRDPSPLQVLTECIENIVRSGSDSGECDGLEGFLKQVGKSNLQREYENVRRVKPNVHEWKLLKGLLDFSMEFSCSEQMEGFTLIIQGQYVKFSDVIERRCKGSIKSVKIFALKKVFIDQSYSRIGDQVEVVILAPIWEVIGSPRISLDGKNGQDQPRKALDGSITNSGLRTQKAAHGNPGGNGGERGMFWGIGQNCLGCQRLTISANGGRGGAGQDGGDGAEGRDFYTQYKGDQHGLLVTVIYNRAVDDYIYHGEPGGDGGNGGDGGLGGPKGMAKFVLFGDGLVPSTSATNGKPGTAGAGGAPGKGGRSDRRIHRVKAVLVVPWTNDETIELPPASEGSWGRNGLTHRHTGSPKGRFTNPSQTLTSYITLLRAKINTSLSGASTRRFLRNLENVVIDDVKHHVGRRSAAQADEKHSATMHKTGRAPSFITKLSTFISTTMGIHPIYGRQLSDTATDRTVNNQQLTSFQWIKTGDSQTLNEIPKMSSFHSEIPAVGNGFGVSNMQSTLLLLDYLRRTFSRDSVHHKKKGYTNSYDNNYAQSIAYRAYAPRAL